MYRKSTVLIVVAAACLGAFVSAEVDCDSPPPRVNPRECCPHADLVTDDVKEKCKKFLPKGGETDANSTKPPHRHPPHHHPCLDECFFNETKIATAGKVDEANLKAYLDVVFKDTPDMVPVYTESFNTCSAKAEEFKAKMDEKMKNNPRPSPPTDRMARPRCRPNFMMGCVRMETLKNCPASIWSNSDECNSLREHISTCKFPGRRGRHGPKEEAENDM